MKQIDFVFRTLLAELAQRIAHTPESELDTNGRFVPLSVKGRRYWYFDAAGFRGGKVRKYVGPDEDEAVRQTVTRFKELKEDANARRKIVRMLVREANLPAPDPFAGKIIRSIADAGQFRSNCVLLERYAYQCFAAFLGVQLPMVPWDSNEKAIGFSIRTNADIVALRDILRSADRSFAPETFSGIRQGDVRFVNANGFRIELAAPTLLTAYLVEDSAKSVVLYKSGVEVTIPRPERYAVHELIMSARPVEDDNVLDREHSRMRALAVIEGMLCARRQADLAEAYEAAWTRNDSWKALIERGITLIDDMQRRTRILEGLTQGMKDIGCDPSHVL
ncbi:hypothetical protein FHS21_006070 [Phyllobacterium trifolii]|uniref:Nucleotidyltransferase-like domain-containing protein n=1 Tax=Phyllobacterium trifolii TaxID=300193 RepID=A0A839UF25_9HYPH|nr:GSU2403 family nucleotidyltransferase fold protein [Phyllobacterium trifolii]MBB3149616.1 hypothetical protein [Phyllobacterium trifolii]